MTEATQYPTTLSSNEYMQLVRGLQQHHALFYQFWIMGKPFFTDRIKTAAVAFDKEGNLLSFLINYDFWQTLTLKQKLFVISHECWHVTMNHGMRGIGAKGYINTADNKAMDLVVNHTLEESFGFDRTEIDPENKWCWIDTVFGEFAPEIKKRETFEYYLLQLKKYFPPKKQENAESEKQKGNSQQGNGESTSEENNKEQGNSGSDQEADKQDEEKKPEDGENKDENRKPEDAPEGEAGAGSGGNVLDDHTFQDYDEVLKEIADRLSDEDKQSLQDIINRHMVISDENSLSRGTMHGGAEYFVPKKKNVKKKKWETIIKKWMHRVLQEDVRTVDQWLRTNRRFSLMDSNIILPSEYEIDDIWEDKKKILVYFFQDTSGSCGGYIDRFFAAAESLPTKRFDVKMHCFDTKVYETTLESRKIYGGGGTAFNIIENYIQAYITKNKLKYPEKCFIITDGYGNAVTPEKPKNWDWFLTPENSKAFIPKESGIYNLSDFE